MSSRDQSAAAQALESEWPERLCRGVRRVLHDCGLSHSEWVAHGFDVHHIVAAGLDGALPARRVMGRWSISVHSVVNAAIIPRSFHQGQGLHRLEFLQLINQRLSSAEMFAEAVMQHGGFGAGRLMMLQTIQKIGSELVLRSGDGVAIRLQSALHRALTRPAEAGHGRAGLRSEVGGAGTGRHVRERSFASGKGSDRGDAAILGSRRSGFQLASACP